MLEVLKSGSSTGLQESIQKTHTLETMVWQDGFFLCRNRSCPLQFLFPASVHPSMEKVQPCLLQGQNKSLLPESLLHSKVQSFGTHIVCYGSPQLLRLHGFLLPVEREYMNISVCVCYYQVDKKERKRGREKERDRQYLFSWDYISLGLG